MNEPAAKPKTRQKMRFCQKLTTKGQKGVAIDITSIEPLVKTLDNG